MPQQSNSTAKKTSGHTEKKLVKLILFFCIALFCNISYAKFQREIILFVDLNSPSASKLAQTVKTKLSEIDNSKIATQIIGSNNQTNIDALKITSNKKNQPLLITIGSRAAAAKFEHLPGAQSLSLLLTTNQFKNLSVTHFGSVEKAMENGNNAILLEPAIKQYLSLGKLLLPQSDNVGVIFGELGYQHANRISKISQQYGLTTELLQLNKKDNPIQKLTPLIKNNDFIIVLPDNRQFNRSVSKWLLQLSLRYRKPVIAFSESYVKAGASAAGFATLEDIAQRASEAITDILKQDSKTHGKKYKQTYYSTSFNNSVIRSIGISTSSNGK